MRRSILAWLYALLSAAIAGGANAIVGAIGGPMFAPEVFNADATRDDMLHYAAFLVVTGAIGGAATLLAKSPLPDLWPSRRRRETLAPPQPGVRE